MMPIWRHGNLEKHHDERLDKNPGCFEKLMGIAGRCMTKAEYAGRTHVAFSSAWAEYEGEHMGKDRRAYYVDGDLVLVVTDLKRRYFITCFHEHFDSGHCNLDDAKQSSPGQLRLKFRDRLDSDEDGKVIRNLKRIRGVPKKT